MTSPQEAIAITGLGAVLPGRTGVDGFSSLLRDGFVAIEPLAPRVPELARAFDPTGASDDSTYTTLGALVHDDSVHATAVKLAPDLANVMDRALAFALVCASEAL
jgi:acyl transferase domain-containing protein